MRSESAGRFWMLVLVLVVASAQSRAAEPKAKSPPGTAPNNTPFTTWRDPREDAFRLGVPVGWKVSGGTVRAASIDVRGFVRAESPDGTIKVFLDDPDLS